jgi:hypothetical protein
MCFTNLVFCNGDNLTKRSRNDSFLYLATWNTHHCMCFTTSCLTVRKNGSIVTVDNAVDKGESALLIDKTLSGIGVKNTIKGKTFGLLFIIFLD